MRGCEALPGSATIAPMSVRAFECVGVFVLVGGLDMPTCLQRWARTVAATLYPRRRKGLWEVSLCSLFPLQPGANAQARGPTKVRTLSLERLTRHGSRVPSWGAPLSLGISKRLEVLQKAVDLHAPSIDGGGSDEHGSTFSRDSSWLSLKRTSPLRNMHMRQHSVATERKGKGVLQERETFRSRVVGAERGTSLEYCGA